MKGDRERWDERWRAERVAHPACDGTRHDSDGTAAWWTGLADRWSGATALDVACGLGASAVWLAQRGYRCDAIDISPVALDRARLHAERHGVAARVTWHETDLDTWDPGGQQWDVVLCLRFFSRPLIPVLQRAVAPGGVLATEVLTRAASARFGADPGELAAAFTGWEILAQQETDEHAVLCARRPLSASGGAEPAGAPHRRR